MSDESKAGGERRSFLQLMGLGLTGAIAASAIPNLEGQALNNSEKQATGGSILESDQATMDRFWNSTTVNRGDIEGLNRNNVTAFTVMAENFPFNFMKFKSQQNAEEVLYVELANASNSAVRSWYSMTELSGKMRVEDEEVDSISWNIGKNSVVEYPALNTVRATEDVGMVFNAPFYVPNFFSKWPEGMPILKNSIPTKVLTQLR
jgi:hypothetical protein